MVDQSCSINIYFNQSKSRNTENFRYDIFMKTSFRKIRMFLDLMFTPFWPWNYLIFSVAKEGGEVAKVLNKPK